MNYVAIRMLVGDRMKYISLVAGLAFAALLVTQQAAIFTGYISRMGSWLKDTNVADLWVFDEQMEFSDDIRFMQDTTVNRIRGIPGVKWAQPMFKGYTNVVLPDGTSRNCRIIGLDDMTLIGGPPEMVQGRLSDLRRDRAVIMDVEDANEGLQLRRHPDGPKPMKVFDHLSINDHDAVVVGSYRRTKEFFWEPVIYTTFSRARFMLPSIRRTLTYVLVKVQDGYDVKKVAADIQKLTGKTSVKGTNASGKPVETSFPNLAALTSEEFEQRTMWWLVTKTGMLVNFGITVMLGVIIGLLAAGQTFYTFILDNTKHFAALKAMGTSSMKLVQMVVVQVAFVGAVGYGIGIGTACLTGLAFKNAGLAFAMPWQIPVIGAAAVFFCCLLAGTLSLIRVLKLEPAIVFK